MNVSPKIFSPVESKRTFEEISSNIKTLIFQGVLNPGDKLPSETELARQFNVGRQTVREALRILELSGFITIQKGFKGGPVIKDTILNRISSLFLDAFQMEKVSLEDLTLARFKIENLIIQEAINNAGEEDFEALRKNMDSARMKIEDNIIATDENIEFHSLLAKASHNQVFTIVADSILALLRELLSRLPPDIEISKHALIEHEKIFHAIKNKSREEAKSLLEEHLFEVRDRLRILPSPELL